MPSKISNARRKAPTPARNAPPEHLGRAKSLTSTVADRLKARIIDGSIPLGSLLSEKALADSYGVSKTPVREALVQLQAIGLVTILPQKGGLVFQPDVEQVRELLEVRHELEATALRLSMERDGVKFAELLTSLVRDMDDCFDFNDPAPYLRTGDAFHDAFFEYCGNSVLTSTYRGFSPRVNAIETHLSSPQIYMLKRSLEEHRLLKDLVIKGDQQTALRLLREHTMELHSRWILSTTKPEKNGRVAAPPKKTARTTKRGKRRDGT